MQPDMQILRCKFKMPSRRYHSYARILIKMGWFIIAMFMVYGMVYYCLLLHEHGMVYYCYTHINPMFMVTLLFCKPRDGEVVLKHSPRSGAVFLVMDCEARKLQRLSTFEYLKSHETDILVNFGTIGKP